MRIVVNVIGRCKCTQMISLSASSVGDMGDAVDSYVRKKDWITLCHLIFSRGDPV